jgi:hypothetical protein
MISTLQLNLFTEVSQNHSPEYMYQSISPYSFASLEILMCIWKRNDGIHPRIEIECSHPGEKAKEPAESISAAHKFHRSEYVEEQRQ